MALLVIRLFYVIFVDARQDLSYRAEWVNPPVYQFSCAIVHGYFGDPDFHGHFCRNILWTSIKTLAMEMTFPMELVSPDEKIGLIARFNKPRSALTPYFVDFRVL
ncbi:hypothetical protein H5410_056544 [Solanum commersonii]|uniref:Uncharacterized protein n=1 Tax=Solanum commersonii TaxID=4109 RepID=A0A9J5WLL4_SOLCO|nr:hypothetical protein H5410_056544 [Solanum commersonii]